MKNLQLTSRVEHKLSLFSKPRSFFMFSFTFSFLWYLKAFSWSHRAILNRRSGDELYVKQKVVRVGPQSSYTSPGPLEVPSSFTDRGSLFPSRHFLWGDLKQNIKWWLSPSMFQGKFSENNKMFYEKINKQSNSSWPIACYW